MFLGIFGMDFARLSLIYPVPVLFVSRRLRIRVFMRVIATIARAYMLLATIARACMLLTGRHVCSVEFEGVPFFFARN